MTDIFKKHKKAITTGAVVLGLICAFVIVYNLGKGSAPMADVQIGMPGPYEYIEEVTGKDKTGDIEKIRDVLGKMINSNSYFQINNTKDSYQVALFNTKGQGFVQDTKTGNISIFRGDNKSVLYTDTVELVYDINVLQMLDFGLELVDEGVSKMYKDTAVEDIEEGKSENKLDVRYVDIVGYDNIEKLYSKIDTSFGELMVTNLKANTIDKGDVTLRLIYVTSDENQFSGGCNIIIGEEEYSSWNFDGYIELYDWELSKEWFDYDYDNIENTDELEEMLTNLAKELDDMMHKYAEDNNLPDAEEKEENPIVREEADGHYHEDGTYHSNTPITDTNEDNPIIKEDSTGHYHEDGTFHPNESVNNDDSNPIIREDEEGHYHEDGTFHPNN